MAPTMVNFGFLPVKRTVFFLCDIQESFRGEQLYFDEIVQTAEKMTVENGLPSESTPVKVQASKTFGIPLIVTEQCPMQNGRTVKELDVSHAHGIYPKTKFSMAIPEVNEQLDKLCDGNVQCGVLFGMQAHISIEQTAAELCGLGIQVHVIADACTASSQEERILALQRLKQIGCFITTCESILYKLLGDEDHPKANEVKQLLDKPRPPTGLAVPL